MSVDRQDLTPLATKLDLAAAKTDLVKWIAAMLMVVVGLTLIGIGAATAVILNRIAAAPISAPAQGAGLGPPSTDCPDKVVGRPVEKFILTGSNGIKYSVEAESRILAECAVEGAIKSGLLPPKAQP